MSGKFGKFGCVLMAMAFAGCATQDAYDIRPEEQDGVQNAVEWQNAHDREIAAATQPQDLAVCVKTAVAADALLAQVGPAYGTDPLVATRIAAVTQFVMASGSAGRTVWREALLRAAKASTDDYRTVFFLEQLRWCGSAEDVPAVRALAESSARAGVKSFAAIAARELGRRGN